MGVCFINDVHYHKSSVSQIEWSPSSEFVFMTAAGDGKIFVWDQEKCGEEQARHDYQDGPPELIFPHESHNKNNIEDIGWSPFAGEDEHMAVSIDTQMNMQVWKMSDDFFFNETDFTDKLELITMDDIE